MTTDERDHDKKYRAALKASLEHHNDGANRTEETYQSFDNYSDACALCTMFTRKETDQDGYTNSIHLDGCPLGSDFNCCREWKDGRDAKFTGDFPAFHAAEIALAARIERELERVKALQETPKSAHKAGDRCELPVWDDSWECLPQEPHHFEYAGVMVTGDCPDGMWVHDDKNDDISFFRGMSYYYELLTLVLDKPEAKPVKTMVTVWKSADDVDKVDDGNIWLTRTGSLFSNTAFTLSGLPDIADIIAKTLGEGALAIKVKCSEEFRLTNNDCRSCDIWIDGLLLDGEDGWRYEGYRAWYENVDNPYFSVASIDAAVSAYLASKKPKEREFKVGDVVGKGEDDRLREIIRVRETGNIDVKYLDGDTFTDMPPNGYFLVSPAEASSFRDAKYTRPLGNLGIRAYERVGSDVPIGLLFGNGDKVWLMRKSGEALCAALNPPLPIYTLKEGEEPSYPEKRGEK